MLDYGKFIMENMRHRSIHPTHNTRRSDGRAFREISISFGKKDIYLCFSEVEIHTNLFIYWESSTSLRFAKRTISTVADACLLSVCVCVCATVND